MSVEIELMPDPARRGLATSGGVECEQAAVITVDRATFEQIWTPSTLELLARSYWRFVRRCSLGLIRVEYREDSQTVVLLSPRIPLLRFRPPRFETGAERASVEWPIERGLLVARSGRGRGFLRIEAEHRGPAEGVHPGPADGEHRDPADGVDPGTGDDGRQRLVVSSTVSNFYPWIRGGGRLARLGTWVYAQTQLRIHIAVTKGFLRSLEGLPAEVLRRGEAPGGRP